METKIKGALEVDFTTVPNVCNSTIDDFTLRFAIYVNNMLIGNEVTPQDKDLRTAIVADSSKRFDFELIRTPARFLDIKIAYACSSTDYNISSASGAIFEGVSYDKAYMILGLINCEPKIVAYSGPT
jgi:hypothetical protein